MATDRNTNLTDFPLHRVEIANWIVAVLLTFIAALAYPPIIAKSILIGGILANVSFLFMKKDLKNFLQGKLLHSGKEKLAKLQFYIKYYGRLAALAAILYLLIRSEIVQPIGLLIGLSTVTLSILITVTTVIKRVYFTAKEA
jgi:hypothetical protein